MWHEQHQAHLTARPRLSPRHDTTDDVPARMFVGDRSIITRAIGEVRPLLAQRELHHGTGHSPGSLNEVI